MDQVLLIFLLTALSAYPRTLQALATTSHITVQGSVFCDVCHEDSFSKNSYFLQGVDVHIQCRFKASSPRTAEQITFSVNRTTDGSGIYKLDIPSVDGIDCVEDPFIQSFCEASLIGSSSGACNGLGLRSTTNEITIKSKQQNLCIYSMSALSFRPLIRNASLCGNHNVELPDSLNSSKFFLPYFPPYGIPWPNLPPLPPLPQFPPLPPIFPPLPPFSPLPFPPTSFPKTPSLPFPFPPIPTITPAPPGAPPAFNPRDPKSWQIPNNPLFPPREAAPPPPTFNFLDPRTWFPNNPPVSSPSPPLGSPPQPVFNPGDPRTWIPYNPPSPPHT